MKRISFFYTILSFGIVGLIFASVSYAASVYQFDERDPNYQLALSIAAAQEAKKELNINEKIILDEDFTPGDFGLTGVGILPTSPFYFLKGIRRIVQSAITFNPVAEAELKLRFSAEKLLEAKAVAGATGASLDDIKYALENFQGELQRVSDRTKQAANGLEEGAAVALAKKLMDSTVKYEKSLGKIEKTLPPELFENMKLAKEKTSETFGSAFDLVKPEKATEELTGVLETQKGSEFKDFKNIEVLKEIEEKAPVQAKDAMRAAQEQALARLQGELEKLQLAKRSVFEDFVREIGGSEARQLEIITDLEAQPLSADVRDVLASVKEEALSKTDKRLQTLTQPQQEKFLEHLAQGNIKNIRVLKELEQNVSKGVLRGITQAKERAEGSVVENIKEGESKEEAKQKLLGELEQSHDAGSLAVLDEIEALIPSDKKAFFSELKQKAVVEIKRDIDRAGTASQRRVVLSALAGDHPEQFGVIERFQKDVEVSFDIGSIWEGIRKAQIERLGQRTESIKDKDRLTRLEEEFAKQKEKSKEFRQSEELFRTQRNVFDSPERAQAQIREAEERIAQLDGLIKSLPFDVSAEQGEFDPFLAEIEQLLGVAEQKLKAAHEWISQEPGRAFGFANAASAIARKGIQMAQEYKSGKKIVRCPFFFPPPPNFCLNGKMVSDIDQNGCQLPPRCEFIEQCPLPQSVPFDFCSNGRIVYEKSPQGCPLPPRCEEFRTCPLVADQKPCAEGSYREGFYKDGCFVYGECRTKENYVRCGGAAGLKCPSEYHCEMPTTTYPDAMGKCVLNEERPVTCQAYWQGYVFDASTKSCRFQGTSGCSDPFVYHAKEECEKANAGGSIFPYVFSDGYKAYARSDAGQHCYAVQNPSKTFIEECKKVGTYLGGTQPSESACSFGFHSYMDGSGTWFCLNDVDDVSSAGTCYELNSTARISCPPSGASGGNCPSGYHFHTKSPGFCMNNNENQSEGCFDGAGTTRITCPSIPVHAYKASGPTSVCPATPTVTSCPAGQKMVTTFSSPQCGTYYGCEVGTTSGNNWGEHIWKFSDGVTEKSFVLNRTDAEYLDYIKKIEAQCLAILKSKFAWKPQAGNSDLANWQNFGIPDCSGTAVNYVCGNKVCDPGETNASCAVDCGGTPAGSCFSKTTEAICKSFGCTWYIGHYDGTHCDDAAHGSTTSTVCTSPGGCKTSADCAKAGYYWCTTDSQCYSSSTTCPFTTTTKPQCSDGKDNDSDGMIDYPADTGCYGTDDNDETTAAATTGGGCVSYASQTSCQSAGCSWYVNHYDGTHCDDAAHGNTNTTTFTCNNNKTCESNENYTSCPGDCGGTAPSTCSTTPSACTTQSACTGAAYFWCNGACYGTQASCPTSSTACNFNNVCDSGESTGSCPSDCRSTTSGYCGDHICSSDETATSCPTDCGGSTTTTTTCGDHVCSGSETSATCPMDCGTTSPTPPPSTTTTCPSGQYWYVPPGSTSGYCKPTSTTDCPSGQIWDSATNMCKSSASGASLFTPFLKLFWF